MQQLLRACFGVQEQKVWVEDSSHPEGGSWQYDYAITNVEYTGVPAAQQSLLMFSLAA